MIVTDWCRLCHRYCPFQRRVRLIVTITCPVTSQLSPGFKSGVAFCTSKLLFNSMLSGMMKIDLFNIFTCKSTHVTFIHFCMLTPWDVGVSLVYMAVVLEMAWSFKLTKTAWNSHSGMIIFNMHFQISFSFCTKATVGTSVQK